MESFRSERNILTMVLALILSVELLLSGCGTQAPGDVSLASVETPAPSHTVTFYANGEVLETLSVSDGKSPRSPEADGVEGLRFLYWMDMSGSVVDPEALAVTADTEYEAIYAPVLDRTEPYLFTDANGLLRPDEIMDNTELVTALNALASEAAKMYFPVLPETGGAVTVSALREVLGSFYTAETLEEALAGLDSDTVLTRAQFALVMNHLLGRDTLGPVVVSQTAYHIPDVTESRADFAQLMEAAVPHSHGEGGVSWQEAELTALYSEGFTLIDGSLYSVDAEGYFISDTVIGTLTFGYDGRYTSGDATLDGYVRGVLSDLAYAHPGADRMELLRAAYNYTRDSFSYLRRNIYEIGHTGWEIADAITMFESSRGNCYSYTAVFWALARGLGYEANAISGTIGRDYEPHGWVEIEIDGANYYFDPETEMAYNRDGEYSKDMFMMGWGYASGWFYYKG